MDAIFIYKTQSNLHNLNIGDRIEFVNNTSFLVKRTVTRITDKSCYLDFSRNSWNTINEYFNEFNVKIIKPSVEKCKL